MCDTHQLQLGHNFLYLNTFYISFYTIIGSCGLSTSSYIDDPYTLETICIAYASHHPLDCFNVYIIGSIAEKIAMAAAAETTKPAANVAVATAALSAKAAISEAAAEAKLKEAAKKTEKSLIETV